MGMWAEHNFFVTFFSFLLQITHSMIIPSKPDFNMDKFGVVGVVYIFICIFGIIGNGMIVISLAFFLKISSMTEGELSLYPIV